MVMDWVRRRMYLGEKNNLEFQPLLAQSLTNNESFRRIWAVFTAILAYSRWACVGPNASTQVKKMALFIHALEVAYFVREFKASTKPTPFMTAFIAVVMIIPSALTVDLLASSWMKKDSDKK
mmetsp:Transcript_19429/g.38070  ORF Transcript_19429/g.38070 Transcript_19429/m.38070 type:complete len:122 (-) Transcript_19429:203-568(-)